jgi:hypothetical protein
MHGVSILVVTAVLPCAACSGSDSDQAGDVPPPPEVGQCRFAPDSNVDPGAIFDDSPVVDCSQTHTLQRLEIIEIDEAPNRELLAQLAKYCESQAAAEFVDSPGAGPYNIAWPIVYGPTLEQQEAGQSWVRCDLGFRGETQSDEPLQPQTESAEGAAGKDIALFQQCTAEIPHPGRSQALVSCKKAHRAELLLATIELDAKAYPPAAELEMAAQSQCGELVANRDDADA